MKTTLTKKNLEILYNMACQMAPFNTLPMPNEHEMEIQISSNACGHFTTILQTLLHEMVHLALYVRGDDDFHEHGTKFLRIKNVYSELYNFDPKAI